AALGELGSDLVTPGDRVFIYYSGHGARVTVTTDGRNEIARESLVPVDVDADPADVRLLYDFELNALLARIAQRTSAITFVLDCWRSAGSTRSVRELEGLRCFQVGRTVTVAENRDNGLSRSARGVFTGLAATVEDCQVVAACLNHEAARESRALDGV